MYTKNFIDGFEGRLVHEGATYRKACLAGGVIMATALEASAAVAHSPTGTGRIHLHAAAATKLAESAKKSQA